MVETIRHSSATAFSIHIKELLDLLDDVNAHINSVNPCCPSCDETDAEVAEHAHEHLRTKLWLQHLQRVSTLVNTKISIEETDTKLLDNPSPGIRKLVEKYSEVFQKPPKGLPPKRPEDMKIET
ncbi:hypothetical protein HK102_003157 [Quaeritorhiza haematococci]|nr:hypothetical protein HK102_003157 [Quaeritorhiza haematococci]